jgi:spore coat polysaccharide biosynthesis protein SpsF
MGNYKSEQEIFWAGQFGDDYIARNEGTEILASNTALFCDVLKRAGTFGSVLEFGANIGMNLRALRILAPKASYAGIEINATAASQLRELGFVDVHQGSILDYLVRNQYDLVLIKTVLIHIAPEFLPAVYEKLYSSSARYICVAEYYNNAPVEVAYRGHSDRLYKRDFAKDLMDQYPDLVLVDYGFRYRFDPAFPLDDITWFLLEKKPCA